MHQREWQVLIVEDEPDSLELMQTLLGHQGIASTGTQTAEEALAVLNEMDPTLVIIDLALPAMDGWGFLQCLQVDPTIRGVPKVAITAFHTPLLAAKAMAAGFDAFFSKPIEAVSFVHDLDTIVSKKYS